MNYQVVLGAVFVVIVAVVIVYLITKNNNKAETIKGIFAASGIELSTTQLSRISASFYLPWHLEALLDADSETLRAFAEVAKTETVCSPGDNQGVWLAKRQFFEEFFRNSRIPAVYSSISPTTSDVRFYSATNISGTLVEITNTETGVNHQSVLSISADAVQPALTAFSLFSDSERSQLWVTGSARAESLGITWRFCGLAVPEAVVQTDEGNFNPSAMGLTINVAIAGAYGSGGAYNQFLSRMDEEALYDFLLNLAVDHLPTWQALSDAGVISAQDIEAWANIRSHFESQGFEMIDLTGVMSVSLDQNGELRFFRVNPVWVLVYNPS